MSFLIEGMEMPRSRPACIVIDAAGQARRYDLNNDRYSDDKLFETISVPPHGRLIDADALTETTDGIWDCNDLYFQPNDKICDPNDCKGCKWRETMDCFRRMVKHAPTIIPAEEKQL